MQFEDEKDYIMRIIKEMVAILSSLVLGKQYVQVELDKENKYGVSGAKPEKWKQLIDAGKINEAENMLLETLDYHDKDEVAAAKRQGRTFLQGNAGAGDDGAKRGAAASLRQTFQVHQPLSGYQQKRRADYQNQPVCGKPQA